MKTEHYSTFFYQKKQFNALTPVSSQKYVFPSSQIIRLDAKHTKVKPQMLDAVRN
jgi:hypothetical protein